MWPFKTFFNLLRVFLNFQLLGELEASTSSICGQAKEHIYADEVILTYGASSLVEKFLKSSGTNKMKILLVEGPKHAEVYIHCLYLI